MITPYGLRLDGFHAVRHQLTDHLVSRADACSAEAVRHRAALQSPEAVRAWQIRSRQVFLDAVGGVPTERTPLNTRTYGEVTLGGAVVEKVSFESLPGFTVTASLYRPKRFPGGKLPGILFPCGHDLEAKAASRYQQVCSALARNGFVVLAFDPIGQGERIQCLDRATGAQTIGWGVREHCHLGLCCTAIGQNTARYMVWDGIRALDYLSERPEVDATRLGITGNSGGGTQAAYLMLMEDRLAAAAPGTYITSRQHYIRAEHAHDAEQNLFAAFPRQLDYAEFLIGFAPKPVMVLACGYDFFPIEGTEWTLQQARRVYGLYGAESRCRLTVDPATHGYTPALRTAALGFFAETLQGRSSDDLDPEPDPVVDPATLQCTRSGQVLLEERPARTLVQVIAEAIPPRARPNPDSLRARVRELVAGRRPAPAIRPRILRQTQVWGRQCEWLFFFSEPDVIVSGILVRPAQATGPLEPTVVLLPRGTDNAADQDLLPRLQRFWTGQRAMLLLDVRGAGPLAAEGVDPAEPERLYGPTYKQACDAWMLGDNLVCMRAYDVLRAIEYLRGRADIAPQQVGLYAEGSMTMAGLLAAVADARLARTEFSGLPDSYAAWVRTGEYDRRLVTECTLIHGMLREFDIPDLLSAL